MQTLSSPLSFLSYLPIFLPHFLSLPWFPFPPSQTHSSINGTSVAIFCAMPDAYRLLSDLSLLWATAQIKHLTLFIFSPLPAWLLPCIKNSSTLCCVKSTLHKTLNIRPPWQEPFVPLRLCSVCVYACIVCSWGVFHCSVVASVMFSQILRGAHSYRAQEPLSGANKAIQQLTNR